MTFSTLEQKITVQKRKGRVTHVTMPYSAYKKLRDAFVSQEIFNSPDTQKSIKRAKDDLKAGRVQKFRNANEVVRSLDK